MLYLSGDQLLETCESKTISKIPVYVFKELRQLEEALYFKAVRIPKQAQGELFTSSFRKFDSRETHADLTNQLLVNRVTNFLRMHDRKVNGCRQRLLFAHQLMPRKCSLCSQGTYILPVSVLNQFIQSYLNKEGQTIVVTLLV